MTTKTPHTGNKTGLFVAFAFIALLSAYALVGPSSQTQLAKDTKSSIQDLGSNIKNRIVPPVDAVIGTLDLGVGSAGASCGENEILRTVTENNKKVTKCASLESAFTGIKPRFGHLGIGQSGEPHANFRLQVKGTTGAWYGGAAFGNELANVVIGELSGKANIGAHNPQLTGWQNLHLQRDGGNVQIGGGDGAAANSLLRVEGDTASQIFKDIQDFNFYVDPYGNQHQRISIYVDDQAGGHNILGQSSQWIGGGWPKGLVQYSGNYVYPGRVDTSGWQNGWYLGTHGSYGLYTNTGLYVASNHYQGAGSAIYFPTGNWSGNIGNSQGKIQYHADRFYLVAGANSDRIVQFRRDGTDLSWIDNSGTYQGNATSATTLAPSGTGGRVTFSTSDSGLHVANAEGAGGSIRLGAAWGLTGIYNNPHITVGSEGNINFVTNGITRGTFNGGGLNSVSGFQHNGQSLDSRYLYWADQTSRASAGFSKAYTNRPSITGNTQYWTGATGWGTTHFNNMGDWGSTFFDTWGGDNASVGGPGPTSHYQGHQVFHSFAAGTGHGYQFVVCGPCGNAQPYIRSIWGGGWNGWQAFALQNTTVTFGQVHATDWFRNSSAGHGIYNTANANHFYSENANRWTVTSNGGYPQIAFRQNHNTGIVGYVYSDGAAFGLLNNQGSWAVRIPHNTNTLEAAGTICASANCGAQIYTDAANQRMILQNNYGPNGSGYQATIMAYNPNQTSYPQAILMASSNADKFVVYGDGSIYAPTGLLRSSDVRLKTNISTITNTLDKLHQIRGVYYNWKTDAAGDNRKFGVIAQEVQPIFPELIRTRPADSQSADKTQYLTADYESFGPILIEAVKELDNKFDSLMSSIVKSVQDLTKRITTNEGKVQKLEQIVETQQKQIEELQKAIKEIKK